MIRYALILAAGLSKRIGKPKQLIIIDRYPLIWYPIAILHSLGVTEICVVTRDEIADPVKETARRIMGRDPVRIIINDEPEKENGYSLLLGLKDCGFGDSMHYVSMSDHIYSPFIPARLMGFGSSSPYVIAGDKTPIFINVEEATKIISNGLQGYAVGKELRYWSHIDSGVHLADPRKVLPVIRNSALLSQDVLKLNDVTNYLGKIGELGVAEFSALPWTEVDTITDVSELREGRRREVIKHVINWLHS